VANCDGTVVARFAEPLVETGREAVDMPPLTPEDVPPVIKHL